MPHTDQDVGRFLPRAEVIHGDRGCLGIIDRGGVYRSKHAGQIKRADLRLPFVQVGAQENDALQVALQVQASGRQKLIRLVIDEFKQKLHMLLSAQGDDPLGQIGQKQVAPPAQNDCHKTCMALLQVGSVGVAHIIEPLDHLIHIFAGERVNLLAVVEHAGNGADADPRLTRDIPDGDDPHLHVPLYLESEPV